MNRISRKGGNRKTRIHASNILCTTGRSGRPISSWMVRGHDRTRARNKPSSRKDEYDNQDMRTIRICEGRNTTHKEYK